MSQSHSSIANFIWSICDLLRGPYKRNEYRKVILPLTVLRRFDCVLADTREAVLTEHQTLKGKGDAIVQARLTQVSGRPFYNLSPLDFPGLLNDPKQLSQHLVAYINAFSPNVRDIMEAFDFERQIAKMAEKDLLFEVVKAFCSEKIDLSPERVDNTQMGYVFEELIRIGAEQSNEEAGEHFTPREVIRLMVNLLLSHEEDLGKSHVVKTIYDPACGTGGMLSVAEDFIRDYNADANPHLFGQDLNDEAWAVCKSDMLIKGENAANIRRGDTFLNDAFEGHTFDYMLANPPFGVSWKQQEKILKSEHETRGFTGRFGAGLPRVNDGSLLFLQHMLSKMRSPDEGGSRLAIVFNGSPLFTGDAGSGESNIRQWIIENDWLEAVVALPEQLFYNTGISTYVWVLTNRKEFHRAGKVQLIDARRFWVPMRKSLGNKRRKIGDPGTGRPEDEKDPDHVGDLTQVHGEFQLDGMRTFEVDEQKKKLPISKVFDNEDFGFYKITVERPLRLRFEVTEDVEDRLQAVNKYRNFVKSRKKNKKAREKEIAEGKERQEVVLSFSRRLREDIGGEVYRDREQFQQDISKLAKEWKHPIRRGDLGLIVEAFGERDPEAEICRDKKGNPEPDADLRDTETIPLKEDIEAYFKREVLPHVPDAWIDPDKTKIGYEIPLNRHFYQYEPPRPLEEIEGEIKELETEIVALLKEVTA